ncbi:MULTISPECIES: acyl-CoA carboxylase subunit epsilon [unclassified Frankia]|uniref:acyl-CoA carboxylase subunit epsilon n=1 Tax=unclassified Frankia TaxID=2632575 RepID=UPI002AD1EBD1|nr:MULTISPECIES: acyl-CoA carboxylase subunit epsilon [unclassified Frankia]
MDSKRQVDNSGDGPTRPYLRLVPANASAEEIAALVAVVRLRAAVPPPESAAPSGWTDRAATFRQNVHSGPNTWRQTGFTQGVRTRADW